MKLHLGLNISVPRRGIGKDESSRERSSGEVECRFETSRWWISAGGFVYALDNMG